MLSGMIITDLLVTAGGPDPLCKHWGAVAPGSPVPTILV